MWARQLPDLGRLRKVNCAGKAAPVPDSAGDFPPSAMISQVFPA